MLVSDDSGEITEVRTGPQVAWMMARGYEGAFGRAINRPADLAVALRALPDAAAAAAAPAPPGSMRTLDLLVLLSFGVSLIWFNRGEVFTSVPLQYPPMVYLGLRLAWIAVARARAARPGAARRAAAGAGDAAPPGVRQARRPRGCW